MDLPNTSTTLNGERPLRILIVDDDEADRQAVRRALVQSGIAAQADEVGLPGESLERLSQDGYDLVLLDYYLPGTAGSDQLRRMRETAPETPIVIFTGRGDEEIAVELMKGGAADYLPKASLTPERLASSIRHALEITRTAAARARAEQELREQEERYRTMMNATPQLAWMGNPRGDLYWFNDRWREFTGLDASASASDRQQLLHPEHRERVIQRFRESLNSGESWEDTFPLRGRDGAYRWFLSRAVPIRDASNRIVSWFGTNTDVTAQLEMENALRASEADLLRAIRMRDEMVAVVAHDLRTPVHTIMMSAATLLEIPLSEGERDRHVEMIRRAARGMERLIGDLLDVTRIESRQFVIRSARIPVRALLHEAMEMFEPQASERGIAVINTASDDLPDISGDHDRLAQVLSNLISNALRFTPANGQVSLHASEACGQHGEGHVKFTVSDTGPGIASEHLPNIFDRFWRGERQARSGAGLGLAIAKGIVEAHGGEIWVESVVGHGTTFHFTIPCVPQRQLHDSTPVSMRM